MTKTMNTFFQKLLSALLLACCVALGAGTLGCQNVEGEYEEGVTALEADDYETALKKFRSAAQGNHPGAQAALGELYFHGKGIQRNAPEAAKWYQLAAEQGNTDAQVTLGWMYNVGTGVAQDVVEAINWFRLAADQGHPGAQNNLGMMYREGRGTEKDEEKAVVWFRMAAEQGIAPAQYALGQMYLNGEGVKPRVEKTILWYTRAATQGLVEAQADLGYLYATRKNVIPQDTLNAYKWLALAAQHDGKIAKRDLANVMANMSPDQIKEGDQLVQEWEQEHPGKQDP